LGEESGCLIGVELANRGGIRLDKHKLFPKPKFVPKTNDKNHYVPDVNGEALEELNGSGSCAPYPS
jgi:hypothetical protein